MRRMERKLKREMIKWKRIGGVGWISGNKRKEKRMTERRKGRSLIRKRTARGSNNTEKKDERISRKLIDRKMNKG